jgi:hypothetical protein
MKDQRINMSELQSLVDYLNKETDNKFGFSIAYRKGGVTLQRNGIDDSKKMTKQKLFDFIHGMLSGIWLIQENTHTTQGQHNDRERTKNA